MFCSLAILGAIKFWVDKKDREGQKRGSRKYWKVTYWKDLKGRCLAAGGLKKGYILEGIGTRVAPKAGGLKKGHILEGYLTAGVYFGRSYDRW